MKDGSGKLPGRSGPEEKSRLLTFRDLGPLMGVAEARRGSRPAAAVSDEKSIVCGSIRKVCTGRRKARAAVCTKSSEANAGLTRKSQPKNE